LSFILSIVMIIGFVQVARKRITSAEIAIPMLLGITVLWPWETIRFVLPLVPFLLFYFVTGFREALRLIRASASRKALWIGATAAAAIVIAVSLYGHFGYIVKKNGDSLNRPQWLQTFDDVETMMKWVDQNVPKNETIVALNPPLVHLYTGHK